MYITCWLLLLLLKFRLLFFNLHHDDKNCSNYVYQLFYDNTFINGNLVNKVVVEFFIEA